MFLIETQGHFSPKYEELVINIIWNAQRYVLQLFLQETWRFRQEERAWLAQAAVVM